MILSVYTYHELSCEVSTSSENYVLVVSRFGFSNVLVTQRCVMIRGSPFLSEEWEPLVNRVKVDSKCLAE